MLVSRVALYISARGPWRPAPSTRAQLDIQIIRLFRLPLSHGLDERSIPARAL